MQNGKKVLMGISEISDYLNISKPTFYQFLEMGMPARVIKNRWYAHKDNIDEFFQKMTNKRSSEINEDAD